MSANDPQRTVADGPATAPGAAQRALPPHDPQDVRFCFCGAERGHYGCQRCEPKPVLSAAQQQFKVPADYRPCPACDLYWRVLADGRLMVHFLDRHEPPCPGDACANADASPTPDASAKTGLRPSTNDERIDP